MKATRIGAIFGALACLLVPLARAEAQTKISVGYTLAHDFIPAFLAKDKSIFEKHGLDVTLTRILIASNVPAALVSGSLSIGIGTAPALLLADEGGLDLVVIQGITRQGKANPTVSFIARKGSGISKPEDVKGKKIGSPGVNSVIDVTTRKWLMDHKVPLNQVNFVEVGLVQMYDMLKSGQLDAVSVIEPLRSKILSDGTGVKVSDYVPEVKDNIVFAFWMATRHWAEKNQKAVQAFRDSFAEGLAYMKAHPDEARTAEKKYLGVNAPMFPTYSLDIQPADFNIYVDIGKQLGMLRQPVDTNKLVYQFK